MSSSEAGADPGGELPRSPLVAVLDRLHERLTRGLLVVAALLAFALSFLVVADVIGRVVFNHPVKGTPEMVSTAIVIICFLQAGFAIRSGGMLQVDAITCRLSPALQSWFAAGGCLLGLIFFGVLCWGSWEPAVHAWVSSEFEGEGALRVPAWPTRFVLVLGTAMAAASYLLLTGRHLTRALAGLAPELPATTH